MVVGHNPATGQKIRIPGGGWCTFIHRSTAPERFLSDNPRLARSRLACAVVARAGLSGRLCPVSQAGLAARAAAAFDGRPMPAGSEGWRRAEVRGRRVASLGNGGGAWPMQGGGAGHLRGGFVHPVGAGREGRGAAAADAGRGAAGIRAGAAPPGGAGPTGAASRRSGAAAASEACRDVARSRRAAPWAARGSNGPRRCFRTTTRSSCPPRRSGRSRWRRCTRPGSRAGRQTPITAGCGSRCPPA